MGSCLPFIHDIDVVFPGACRINWIHQQVAAALKAKGVTDRDPTDYLAVFALAAPHRTEGAFPADGDVKYTQERIVSDSLAV